MPAMEKIIEHLDEQIKRLSDAREVLTPPAKRGRPVGSTNHREVKRGGKRTISEEGRKRIAKAMRKRWALKKKLEKKK